MKNPTPRRRVSRRSAFTLIELLLVLVILAVLAAIVVGNFTGTDDKAKKRASQQSMSILDGQIDQFKLDCGRFPTNEEGLNALLTAPADVKDWGGPYIKNSNGQVPKDGWGRDFNYRFPGTRNPSGFDLWSVGKDGQDGTEDDIVHGVN